MTTSPSFRSGAEPGERWPPVRDSAVVFHGSLGNADRIRRTLPWRQAPTCDAEAFRCSAWYPPARPWLIHGDWLVLPANALAEDPAATLAALGMPEAVFVRPDSALKPFSGRILRADSISLTALDHGFYFDDASLPVILAPVRSVGREWRFVVVDRRVTAGSAYASDGGGWRTATSGAESVQRCRPVRLPQRRYSRCRPGGRDTRPDFDRVRSVNKVNLITARLLVDLSHEFEGYGDLAAFGVSCDGAVFAVARASTEDPYVDRGIGRFPKSRLNRPADYLVVAWHDGKIRKVILPSEPVVISFVQPMSAGILLVGSRCHWRPEGPEKNAVIYDWTGHEGQRLTLGDGLEDVRTTTDGTIWASYFDEGVFGNYGWGQPGPTPIGAPGLVAFDDRGEIQWSYDSAAAGTDSICDAYALNVRGPNDVWLYFYTEFSLVQLSKESYRVWKLGERGARAMAVSEPRLLLFGDYRRRDLLRLVELGRNGAANVVAEGTLVDPEGNGFDSARAVGVGGSLFLFRKGRVFVVDAW